MITTNHLPKKPSPHPSTTKSNLTNSQIKFKSSVSTEKNMTRRPWSLSQEGRRWCRPKRWKRKNLSFIKFKLWCHATSPVLIVASKVRLKAAWNGLRASLARCGTRSMIRRCYPCLTRLLSRRSSEITSILQSSSTSTSKFFPHFNYLRGKCRIYNQVTLVVDKKKREQLVKERRMSRKSIDFTRNLAPIHTNSLRQKLHHREDDPD
jgi:hypothetical protein